jgi:hypothetical protein
LTPKLREVCTHLSLPFYIQKGKDIDNRGPFYIFSFPCRVLSTI